MSESWQSISRRKLEARDALIPKEWRLSSLPSSSTRDVTAIPRTCGLLTSQELDITENYDATALADAIASKKLKCIDVTRAFCKRAAIAQQLTNCLTEILFDRALRRAEALDYHLEKYGTPIGPLHGVPVSLKDAFKVTGVDSSIGIAALCFKPAPTTSPLVSLLLNAGAVIYCKTNVPQTMMALDSTNNVFGRTLSPQNTALTAGGSSGGEAALVAMRGSPLGMATDVGGSIRIPAMCNGIYGIKPSAHRVPFASLEGGAPPGLSVLKLPASAGPVSRSLRDCGLFLKAVDAAKPWTHDALMIPGLWNTLSAASPFPSAESRPLTIGIFTSDHLMPPLPPIAALLDEVSAALTAAGHRVVPVAVPQAFAGLQSLANALFGLDGGGAMHDLLEAHGEPLIPWLQGKTARKAPKSLEFARDVHAQRERAMNEMQGALWRTPDGRADGIDAIVAPVAPHPVPRLDAFGGVSYTSAFVLLDYPAGVIPVRAFERRDLDGEIAPGPPLGEWDANNRRLWPEDKREREVYLGSALCVQVLAPRLQERRLFEAMEGIDEALKANADGAKGQKARL